MPHIRLLRLMSLGLAVLLFAGCVPVTREGASSHATGNESAAHSSDQEETHAGPHWGYTGDVAPEFWGDLNPEFELCKTGESQSPIDIAAVNEVDLANLPFSYVPSPLHIVNNGHTIEVSVAEGSSIELDGERYHLAQYHFHSPSEHEIDGQPADLELHLVHKSADGKIAVVGVLFRVGAENSALAPIWAHLPAQAGSEETVDVAVDPATLLPADQTTFRYSGSLTTPPCTQGVSWLLMTQQEELSAEQLAAFTAIYDGNNRPVQPLHGREIQEDITR